MTNDDPSDDPSDSIMMMTTTMLSCEWRASCFKFVQIRPWPIVTVDDDHNDDDNVLDKDPFGLKVLARYVESI